MPKKRYPIKLITETPEDVEALIQAYLSCLIFEMDVISPEKNIMGLLSLFLDQCPSLKVEVFGSKNVREEDNSWYSVKVTYTDPEIDTKVIHMPYWVGHSDCLKIAEAVHRVIGRTFVISARYKDI